MTGHIWWFLARSSGIVASALVAAAVIWGLLLSTRVLRDKPRPAWLLDLHRMLGGLAVVFVALHVLTLMVDSYVGFGAADVLVPFATDWRPGPVAFGILAMYLLVAVELTSLAMRKLPRRWWHGVHLSSYVLFWMVAVHGALAGSDASNLWFRLGSIAAIGAVAGLTLYRVVIGRRARRKRRALPGTAQDPVRSSLARPAVQTQIAAAATAALEPPQPAPQPVRQAPSPVPARGYAPPSMPPPSYRVPPSYRASSPYSEPAGTRGPGA